MAVYAKGFETKRKFITLAYQKLLEKTVDDVTVRELASEKGYSAPAIYKHFESLEYLMVLASVKFLEPYMNEYSDMLKEIEDPLEAYLRGWEIFNHYAFERPDIYFRLFWGQYNAVFTDAIVEYFELFPAAVSQKDLAMTLFQNSDIHIRDYQTLHRVINHSPLTEEDVEYISQVVPIIAEGLLYECLDSSQAARWVAEKKCNELIRKSINYALAAKENTNG